ncbi:FkbM family methyltransferase [Rhodopirellula sp. SWK7]|uniref:FkbM family methyltransferase n=1 Tax=Rhodopirellula sp. SWK7 TaxID=595460 RepID=UPI0002BFF90F|nr:FkbM family methyltransferase [Rhodopirellula sp. SWK7]EMI41657.1 Methyltransferase FkbM domain protein [Rhodopirellula sp. SWK7]
MKQFLRNVITLVQHPNWCIRYLKYRLDSRGENEAIIRHYEEGISVGGFNSFGEYVSLPSAVGKDEESFFRAKSDETRHVFIDVGANLGFVTLLLSKLNSNSTIYAFEAAKSTFNSLQNNIKRNSVSNVELIYAAVTDHEGKVFFKEQEYSRATAKIARSANGVRVEAVRLDDFSANRGIDRIKILKVDVEGHEAGVFRGASNLLEMHKVEFVYFEYCPVLETEAGYSKGEALRLLETFGYEVCRLDGPSLLAPFDPNIWDDHQVTNLVARVRTIS